MDCRVPGDGKILEKFFIFFCKRLLPPRSGCAYKIMSAMKKAPRKKEKKRTALASVGPALLIAAAAALAAGVCFLALGFFQGREEGIRA